MIKTDPVLLRQVFSNLINNAVKFSKNVENPRIKIEFKKSKQLCEFIVSDNGIGLGDHDTSRLFKIFHRAPNAKKFPGTGIGLSNCERIIILLGGSIKAEKQEVGAKFIVSIPCSNSCEIR
ncbi:MAG: ATP-binding protein [Oligoflexales bacterium]|nr:ATP-binding protein [Oligoflexales bacterium]